MLNYKGVEILQWVWSISDIFNGLWAVELEYTSGHVFDEGSIECIINRGNITESEMIDFLDDKYEKGEWLFSQDGARYHTSYTTKDWLETQGIYKWPANSPDLTPIEKF